jgi:alpha-N-arabinofuranosidase
LALAVRAQGGPLRARIKVDTERVIGEIDPKIYGNFIEHLGRCIDGGVFEENSPLSDSNGFRKDVMEAVKNLNVTQLRWPGGNFVSNYHWMDGIGPRDKRPPRLEMAWGTVESNRFGTHEFLQYADMMTSEPYVCVNSGRVHGLARSNQSTLTRHKTLVTCSASRTGRDP